MIEGLEAAEVAGVLEVLEVVEMMCFVLLLILDAAEGGPCLQEVMRRALLCMLDSVEANFFCLRHWEHERRWQ